MHMRQDAKTALVPHSHTPQNAGNSSGKHLLRVLGVGAGLPFGPLHPLPGNVAKGSAKEWEQLGPVLACHHATICKCMLRFRQIEQPDPWRQAQGIGASERIQQGTACILPPRSLGWVAAAARRLLHSARDAGMGVKIVN